MDSTHRGRGVGRLLKQAIVAEPQRLGYHSLIARVVDGSNESIHLNESVGFVRVGTLREVGRKFDRWLDVHIFQMERLPQPNRRCSKPAKDPGEGDSPPIADTGD